MKIKRQVYQFVNKSGEADTRFEMLETAIEKDSQDGWEPWGIETASNFNTDYSELHTLATVWYKQKRDK